MLFNAVVVVSVCLAGAAGWLLSPPTGAQRPDEDELAFNPLAQVFGYLCAALYLASRVPQIALNYRRRSCDGVSVLFFLFAGIGNATYVLSILAAGQGWSADRYWRYIGINASWLAGSMGTIILDMVILVQFFWYQDETAPVDEDEVEGETAALLG